MSIFSIKYEHLQNDDKLEFLEKTYKKMVDDMKKIRKLRDIQSAIKHQMQRNMWFSIPLIFNTIYKKDVECANAPNDWSSNYKLGAQIFIMVKHGIVKYVNDFYCPNT
jgi:hypothetical protein